VRAVRQKDRHVAVGFCALGRGAGRQRQITRQAHQAGQALRRAQAGHERHGAALRKAHEHGARGRHTPRGLAVQQALHQRAGLAQTGFVLKARLADGRMDVVPGAHLVAPVERDRAHRCRGEHKAHRADGVEIEFLRDRHEIVAVGAQAVQHDDARHRRGGGVAAGDEFQGLKGV